MSRYLRHEDNIDILDNILKIDRNSGRVKLTIFNEFLKQLTKENKKTGKIVPRFPGIGIIDIINIARNDKKQRFSIEYKDDNNEWKDYIEYFNNEKKENPQLKENAFLQKQIKSGKLKELSIRANQGHSLKTGVNPILNIVEKQDLPKFLYHGTSLANAEKIIKDGLNRGDRHHAHLTQDKNLAKKRGKILLQIDVNYLVSNNWLIKKSKNNVYFAEKGEDTTIPKEAIQVISNESIGFFPGKFKPPHLEHLHTIAEACKTVDSLIIFISKKSYGKWSAELSKAILEELINLNNKIDKSKVQIKIANQSTPIDDFRNYFKDNIIPNNVYLIKGAKETSEDTRFEREPIISSLKKNKNISNYEDIAINDLIIKPQNSNPISSTIIRNGNYNTIEQMFKDYGLNLNAKLENLYKQGFEVI
jgi:RNA:NAD 2'-phosphotransferase (TPT1/KptA family)/nicotinic acid mononucleotide adenylyltransferase